MKQYKRDKRSPKPSSATASKVMSAIRAKDTKPELLVRKALWKEGSRGFRLHYKKIAGRPDIAFPRHKVAVFVHGCYWHRCPTCHLPTPKSNATFWTKKFDENAERDRKKEEQLRNGGWQVFVLWECSVKSDAIAAIRPILERIHNC